jgi:hypothetical protein
MNVAALMEIGQYAIHLTPYTFLRQDITFGNGLLDVSQFGSIPEDRIDAYGREIGGWLSKYVNMFDWALSQESMVGGGVLLPYMSANLSDPAVTNIARTNQDVSFNLAVYLIRRSLAIVSPDSTRTELNKSKWAQYEFAYSSGDPALLTICLGDSLKDFHFVNVGAEGRDSLLMVFTNGLQLPLPLPELISSGALRRGPYVELLLEMRNTIQGMLDDITFRGSLDSDGRRAYGILALLQDIK